MTSIEVLKDLLAVIALAVHLCCPESGLVEDLGKLLRRLDQRKEDNRLPVSALGLHYLSNLIQVWIKRGPDLSCSEISGLDTYT